MAGNQMVLQWHTQRAQVLIENSVNLKYLEVCQNNKQKSNYSSFFKDPEIMFIPRSREVLGQLTTVWRCTVHLPAKPLGNNKDAASI